MSKCRTLPAYSDHHVVTVVPVQRPVESFSLGNSNDAGDKAHCRVTGTFDDKGLLECLSICVCLAHQ